MPQAIPLIIAGLGAAASVATVVSAKAARSDAAKAANEQKTAAKEAAALESPVTQTDAAFQLGLDSPAKKKSAVVRATTSPATSSTPIGGITAAGVGGL